jgi:hypothetical protein
MDAQRKPPANLFVLAVVATAISMLAFTQAGAAPGAAAQAELIDGGGASPERYAGLRLRLADDALTYWRDPGDAGVAPTFDFSGSQNLGAAEALFPLPSRFEEAGATAIGYKREVVFPLRLSAKDPSRPIALAVAVDYAVCAKICIPGHADLRLDLPPRGEAAPGFATFSARVPRVLDAREAAGFANITRMSDAGGKPQWLLRLARPAADVFVEAPSGFHLASSRQGDDFLLLLDESPKAAATLRVNLTVAGETPVEFPMKLK